MNLTRYTTKEYENKRPLRASGKQTQSNPTCSELVEPISKGGQSGVNQLGGGLTLADLLDKGLQPSS